MSKPSYIYLIKSGTGKNAPIKIGIASSPDKRILELQVGNPKLLTLVCKVKASSRKHAEHLEYSLHQYFKHSHIRGEWFKGKNINLVKAFASINESLNYDDVNPGIHGTKKDSRIKTLQYENQSLRNTIQRLQDCIDADLDMVTLANASKYQ